MAAPELSQPPLRPYPRPLPEGEGIYKPPFQRIAYSARETYISGLDHMAIDILEPRTSGIVSPRGHDDANPLGTDGELPAVRPANSCRSSNPVSPP
jgi:hypothetical protein